MMNTDVVRFSLSQMNQAIKILAYAFNADPMFCYFYAEAEQARLNTVRWLSKMVLHYSQPYNHIYTTPGDPKGIAVWLPPRLLAGSDGGQAPASGT